MSKAVETVKPKVAALEAKTRMRQKQIHHFVVTSGGPETYRYKLPRLRAALKK